MPDITFTPIVSETMALSSGFLTGVTVMTLATVVCGRFLGADGTRSVASPDLLGYPNIS